MVKKFLGLLLIVFILGGGGYVIWEGKNMMDDSKKTNQALAKQLQEQKEENKKLKNEYTELEEEMQKVLEENEKVKEEAKKAKKKTKNEEQVTEEVVLELLNTEKLKISTVSMDTQDDEYYEFTFEVVNKSKKEIEISAKDVALDDKKIKDDNVQLSQTIEPGARETVEMKIVKTKKGKLPSLEEFVDMTFVVVRDGDDANVEEYPATIDVNK